MHEMPQNKTPDNKIIYPESVNKHMNSAKEELLDQGEKISINNLKLQLFIDCYEENNFIKNNLADTFEDLKEINLQFYSELSKIYSDDVLEKYLYSETI
ncbi:MAG: hypothetical protein NTX85_02400 [Candidatus Nomurabacteria bacterium]|nr:hypothetical protein [Candidatus Nomurabacteria bacterium]